MSRRKHRYTKPHGGLRTPMSRGLHAAKSFFGDEKKDFEDVDWDEEIWGDTAFDPAEHNLDALEKDSGAPTSKVPSGYGKTFGSSWGGGWGYAWGGLGDPTDANWDLRREENQREDDMQVANEELDAAAGSFKRELAKAAEELTDADLEVVTKLLGAHADLVIAKVRKDYVERETERVTAGGSIMPADTKREFLNLGARYYRVLKLDPYISQADLDLLAASLEAVRYITPANNWETVNRERELAAEKALRSIRS